MAEMKKVPAIRFKSDSQEWDEKTLLELSENGFTNGVFNDPTKPGGRYKLVNVLDMYIDSTIDEKRLNFVDIGEAEFAKNKVENGDVFFTRSSLVKEGIAHSNTYLGNAQDITFDGHLIRMSPKRDLINSCFLNYLLKTSHARKQLVQRGKTATMTTIGQADIAPVSVTFPKSKDEQTQIGNYFQNLDKLISLHQTKVNKLTNLKKAMLEKMFPKQGADVPEIRFKGFSGAWEESKLGDLMNVTSVKRIHQSDWTSSGVRFLRARDIVAAFKNEEVNEYLYISKEKYDDYSAMSGKVKPEDLLVTGVGTIGIPFLIIDETPIYFKDGNIIWFQNDKKLDGYFFFYSFTGGAIQSFIKDSAGTGTVGTFTIDSGKKTPIKFPEENEQRKIGAYFKNLDSSIALHQNELEKLGNLKKACIEKMFV